MKPSKLFINVAVTLNKAKVFFSVLFVRHKTLIRIFTVLKYMLHGIVHAA